jgi:hypothetical protein
MARATGRPPRAMAIERAGELPSKLFDFGIAKLFDGETGDRRPRVGPIDGDLPFAAAAGPIRQELELDATRPLASRGDSAATWCSPGKRRGRPSTVSDP